jgi:hypothetical protein
MGTEITRDEFDKRDYALFRHGELAAVAGRKFPHGRRRLVESSRGSLAGAS